MADVPLFHGRLRRIVAGNRFYVLLGGLLALMLAAPLVDAFAERADSAIPPYVMSAVFLFMLLGVILALCEHRRSVIIALLLALPAAVLWVVDMYAQRDAVTIAQMACAIALLVYAVLMILVFIFKGGPVSGNVIAASMCIYLLLGVIWGEAYSIIAVVDPGAFMITHSQDAGQFVMKVGGRGTSYALYYSLVTMTTLGYGDVVPISLAARTLATTQAITGQMYLAVLVARLVGMHIAQSTAGSRAG